MSKRKYDGGVTDNNISYSNNITRDIRCTKSTNSRTSQVSCKNNDRRNENWLLNCRGSVSSIEFLIYFTLFIFILFSGIDYFVTQQQYNMLESVHSFYMNKMKIEGTLSSDSYYEMFNKLTNLGFKDIIIEGLDVNKVPLDDNTLLVRNLEDVSASEMELYIKATPKFVPFMFGKLIGITETDKFYFEVGGRTLSEKPMFY